MFLYDIAVVGIGRVGLPLALSLSNAGFKVLGIDRDEKLLESVRNRVMPFNEPGYDVILKKTDLTVTDTLSSVKDAKNIIITVGTPLMSHIETDLSQIRDVFHGIKDGLRETHNIILRSTVAPKTTEYVRRFIEQKTPFKTGETIFLSFCPERIAEGKAIKELCELPQIIGCGDDKSFERASEIFSRLTRDILRTDFVSAELVKLFNNISRYIHFSVANQFAIIADSYKANIYDIIEMTNYKYPRGVIPLPGFTAGTCLRKDFGMVNESVPYTDLLISAWKINEFMPKFLVDNLVARTEIYNKRVAVLGYSFKKDTDDTRDSLVPKLLRYIGREMPLSLKLSDPLVTESIEEGYANLPIETAVSDADIIYFATNHTVFEDNFKEILSKCKNDCYIVDLWNISGCGKMFFKLSEVL